MLPISEISQMLSVGFSPKTRHFRYKKWGYPYPTRQKSGVIPNSDQIFASGATREASGEGDAASRGRLEPRVRRPTRKFDQG